jgi:hypothetical protein
MKNHWLKKKEVLSVENIKLAKELESQGVEDVCVYNEMADVEPLIIAEAPLDGEITIGTGWHGMPSSNEVKIPDITFGDPPCLTTSTYIGDICISGAPYSTDSVPLDLATTITVPNDWANLTELEIGDGNIKYLRETTIGPFTFKDAGSLGVDIFVDNNICIDRVNNNSKIGWLNSNGEESLKQWLNEKPKKTATTTIEGTTYSIGVDPAVGQDTYVFKKSPKKDDYDTKHKIQVVYNLGLTLVSNEVIDVTHVGEYNVYQIGNTNIIPGSFIFTAYVNGIAVQSENLKGDGELPVTFYGFSHTYACERPAISKAKLDHKTGIITVNWVNFNRLDTHILSVCYEYEYSKESKAC